METAVLNLALMPEVMDCNSNTLNAELEVKKLQELVRKLERQNEQLRTRAQPPAPRTEPHQPPELDVRYVEYLEPSAGEDAAGKEAEDDLLEDLELLDLDSMWSSSEDSQETWLYMTQRSSQSSDRSLTPLQWCRQALDSPKSELEATRRSLSLRLEQVSRWRSSLSSPSHSSSPPSSLSRVTGMSPSSTPPSAKPCSTPRSERHGRSLQRSVFSPQSSLDEEESVCVGFKLQDLTDVQVMARMQEESLRQELALPPRRSHSLGSFPPSAGAPSGLERRHHHLRQEEDDEEEDDDEGFALLPPPAPRLTSTTRLSSAHLPHSHTFHSLSHWSGGSPSPLRPSAGYAFRTHEPEQEVERERNLHSPAAGRRFTPGADHVGRSMPNLVRAPSMPCVPLPPSPCASPRASPSCLLRSSHSFDLTTGLSPLHCSIPAPAPLQSRVHSVGSFCVSRPPVKATAYVSPTIMSPSTKSPAHMSSSSATSPAHMSSSSSLFSCSISLSGIPLLAKHTVSPAPPRSALPRPASFTGLSGSAPRSKLTQSGRSFLTPPKNLSTLSALRDSPLRDSPLRDSPLRDSPLRDSPLRDSPLRDSAWRDGCY